MNFDNFDSIISKSCAHTNGVCTCTIIATRPQSVCEAASEAKNESIDKQIAKLRELQSTNFEAQIAALEAQKQGEVS